MLNLSIIIEMPKTMKRKSRHTILVTESRESCKPGTGSMLKFSLELHAEIRLFRMVGGAGTFTVI